MTVWLKASVTEITPVRNVNATILNRIEEVYSLEYAAFHGISRALTSALQTRE
jgi:hypothetical protein